MKRITDDEKIYQMFRNCTEPEAARLLAIAQTVVRQRFPDSKESAPKVRKPRYSLIDREKVMDKAGAV